MSCVSAPVRTIAALALLSSCALMPAGCRAKGQWTAEDELRARVQELESQLATVTAERDESRVKLAELERVRLSGSTDVPADVLAAMPRCAGIEIDRLTGPSSRSASEPAVDVYLRPYDGRQRFVQVAGRVTIRVDRVPVTTAPGLQPAALGQANLDPAALREAYRASPMGTHYSVRVPVAPGGLAPGAQLAITVEFFDALTGQVHTASRLIPLGEH